MEEFKPGDVVRPADNTTVQQASSIVAPQPAQPIPASPPQRPTTPAPQPTVKTEQVPDAGWQYNGAVPDNLEQIPENGRTDAMPDPFDSIAWSASEYTHHEKSMLWYGVLIGTGIIIIALIYLLTKDKITSVIIGLAVGALALYARRQPKMQNYELSGYAIRIGNQVYEFTSFRSFAVYDTEETASIVLMPLKRFMPPLTVYLDRQTEQDVVQILSERLPLLQKPQDPLDSLMRRLKF